MSTPLPVDRYVRPDRISLHPLRALLLAFPLALFPCALLSDATYLKTAQIQWSNFSAWLITGALIPGGFALLWTLILVFTAKAPDPRRSERIHAVLLAVAWIAGLFNAFQHSHDGWSSVGTAGLMLSIVSAVFILAAGWVVHSQVRVGIVGAAR